MPPLPTLVCKECGYVNEGERVYCHGCGAKLDRNIIAAKQQQQAPSLKEKQREVKRIMSPRRRSLPKLAQTFCKTVLLAALAGALIDAARPPEGALPVEPKKELSDAPALDDVLEKMTAAPTGQRLLVTEEQLNAYLQKEHFRKVPEWFTGALPLRRVFVNLENGTGRLTVGGTVAGYPVYAGFSGHFQPHAVPVCTGGAIGRLQIPAPVAVYAGAALPLVLGSLKRDLELLGHLEAVEIFKGQIVLDARKPAAPLTPAVRPLPGH